MMLSEHSPWTGLMRPGRHGAVGGLGSGAGVLIAPAEGGVLALLGARRGKLQGLLTAMRALGVDLPVTPRWIRSRAVTFLWAGPEQWLVRSPGLFSIFERDWASLQPCAVLIDQSHARALLTVGGPQARAVLAKGFDIDLHPRAFAPGDVALTPVAQIPAQIWQIDERPTYEIAVPRSYAGSFWHWLTESAAEYGYGVEDGGMAGGARAP